MPARGESPSAQLCPTGDGAATGELYCDVALNRPVRREFTYRVPLELRAGVAPGARVAVPFGPKREVGVVTATSVTCDVPTKRMRALAAVLDETPIVDSGLLDLTRWMADYYACSWGEALATVLPAALKRERGGRKRLVISASSGAGPAQLAELEERFPKQHRLLRTLLDIADVVELRDVTRRLNISDAPARSLERRGWVRIEKVDVAPDPLMSSTQERVRPEQLSGQQQRAIAAIEEGLGAGKYGSFLLHGITGSGKTEVYLRVIERALELGRGAIVLVPEIALTPQTVGWFRSRFGDVAVLHSRLTDAQRYEMWRRVRSGELRVVVGARSAIFAPVADLGVIVVDEEHEPSFKQGNSPRYHARDLAVYRAHAQQAVCVLGSATPSLESWANAEQGRYRRLTLSERVAGGRLPKIEIVDMRAEKPGAEGTRLFSRRLEVFLRQTLERGEQSILFLNRRGFSPVLWCQACGETVRCKDCDVSLTFHRRIDRTVCHSCCTEALPPRECPTCTAPGLRYLGLGSERVEATLGDILPGARVARMDSDTMHRREDYERTLDAFGRGDLDVLVGTQMIAKGLDFPRVTLVGIVSADSALHLPDFRATERTFQLLSQVSGRAGRGELAGHIVVQTMTPDHPAIVRASNHDYEGFAREESELREDLGYPPHGRLIRVVFEDREEERVIEAAQLCADYLRDRVSAEGVIVLGPAPAPIAQLRTRYRHHLLLKTAASGTGFALARGVLVQFAQENSRPRVSIDVDPVSML